MTIRTSALAAASGLLLALAFPFIDLGFLAWIALVPLFLALQPQQSAKAGFRLGGITGIVFFAGTVYWITNSVNIYGNVPFVPASFVTLALCVYLALYPALFGAFVVRIGRIRPRLLLIAAPAAWTALELARTYVFSGFPWSLLGYSQYRFLPVIQISDITGVYGITFLIVLINAAIASCIAERKNRAAVISAGVVLALVLGYGLLRLNTSENGKHVTISVVQGNIEQDKKWDPAYQAETIAVYSRLTREALTHRPDIVIWPETSTPFYFTGTDPEDRRLTADLREFVKRNRTPLLFGSPTYELRPPRAVILRNSAFLLSGTAETVGKYDKIHLVPFGEYVPLKSVLFFVEKMVQAIGDFASGREYTVMTVPANGDDVKVSTVICYEIIFPDLVRRFVLNGAEVLTTITNDAWFGKTSAPYQHFSMAVFRAVENRVPVARAANTGISGFIDAEGRILDRSRIFTQADLTHTLIAGRTRSFYTRFGDIFSYLCILVTFACFLPFPLKRMS